MLQVICFIQNYYNIPAVKTGMNRSTTKKIVELETDLHLNLKNEMKTIILGTAMALATAGFAGETKANGILEASGKATAGKLVVLPTEKAVKTNPDKVTIYLQGAQVYRSIQVNLVKGDQYIVFEGLENNIDASSVQAGGVGNFIITEVLHTVKYPELEKVKVGGDNKFQKTIKQINDSLELLGFSIEDAGNRRMVLETEKEVLLNYSLYKGTSRKDSISFLREGMTFLREKLNNIYSELMKIKKEEIKLTQLQDKLNQRLQEVSNELGQTAVVSDKNKPDYRVMISVSADAAITATINLNYYVTNAGWTPFYDLRTSGADKGVQLTYKANVKQLTGVDWNNVKVTLSTGNPKQNFVIPTLNQWYVDAFHQNTKTKELKITPGLNSTGANCLGASTNGVTAAGATSYTWSLGDATTAVTDQSQIQFTYDYTSVDQNMAQAEFEIKLNYSIPSDNKNHMVSVSNKELPTKYIYKCIPKLDPTAFLTARITGWEDMNLLPGNATVYFDGTYVGQTYLNTGTVSDTLELSLGQDKNVMVKRIRSKDKTREKLIDNDKVYTYGFDIVIRNGNSKSIEIEVVDQLPLSRNKDVSIEKSELDGGAYDDITGKLTWRQSLKAKDNKKISFGFTVKAPKDMPLAIN
jgi:uncharacterized protein (TIGR02231 family)